MRLHNWWDTTNVGARFLIRLTKRFRSMPSKHPISWQKKCRAYCASRCHHLHRLGCNERIDGMRKAKIRVFGSMAAYLDALSRISDR